MSEREIDAVEPGRRGQAAGLPPPHLGGRWCCPACPRPGWGSLCLGGEGFLLKHLRGAWRAPALPPRNAQPPAPPGHARVVLVPWHWAAGAPLPAGTRCPVPVGAIWKN